MKKAIVVLASLWCFAPAQAQTKTTSFKVYGNCGMCEKRIEAAAKKAGATAAEWDEESKQMKVTFAAKKTNQQKLEKAIAAVGHDTDNATAPAAVYDKLPGCCLYERKAAVNAPN